MVILLELAGLNLWQAKLQGDMNSMARTEQRTWDVVESLNEARRRPHSLMDARQMAAQYGLVYTNAQWEAQNLAPQFDRDAKYMGFLNCWGADIILATLFGGAALGLARRWRRRARPSLCGALAGFCRRAGATRPRTDVVEPTKEYLKDSASEAEFRR